RQKFRAYALHQGSIFFDNGAGTHVCDDALSAMIDHLALRNAIPGARYAMSLDMEAHLADDRARVARFVNAADAREIAFGPNATSLFARLAELIGLDLGERRRIVLSEIDHLANVEPWLKLRSLGAEILWWKARPDGSLDVEDL